MVRAFSISAGRRRAGVTVVSGFVALATTSTAFAQTWIGNRTTPTLAEITSVDATGEDGWPFGFEDLAGDGMTFNAPEPSFDVRSIYAATSANRLFVRAYVSDPNAVAADMVAYIFIDADADNATGGPADDTTVAPFVPDPTGGGYDYIVAVRSDETIEGIWEWQQPPGQYQAVSFQPPDATAEAGQDEDPLLLLVDDHGYVQVDVDLSIVGLTPACDARFFVRTTDPMNNNAPVDEDVDTTVTCVPSDSNNDGIPDAVFVNQCDNDNQCPAGGVCINGGCVIPSVCVDDADCSAPVATCQDGVCVFGGGDSCDSDADCNGLICDNGTCAACTGDASCDPGERCLPDGRCVGEDDIGTGGSGAGGGALGLGPGDEIQGGACACRVGGSSTDGRALLLLLIGTALAGTRFRRGGKRVRRGDR